ncbi:Prolyl 3-hydroxylase [Trichinella spiralis]|uniref:Prolyl 3-hydroxylase n=1 Tax=Trichinella spiralis TaxID=6334 RepID=A0ABR3KEE2_TRISP
MSHISSLFHVQAFNLSLLAVDHGMLSDQFRSVLEKYFKQASPFYYAISHWPENGTVLQTPISSFKHWIRQLWINFFFLYLFVNFVHNFLSF